MKTDNFTLDSVIKLAVLMEERGAKFYSTLESMTSDSSVKEMMHRLAEDERHHSGSLPGCLVKAGTWSTK